MLISVLIVLIGLVGFSLFRMWTGPGEMASIGIIGGADGPTAIYTTTKIAPHVAVVIHIAAAFALCAIIWAVYKRVAK